jgi:hypothetical protein
MGGHGTYRTMTGPAQAHRDLYRRAGEHNGKMIDLIL